MLVIHRLPSRRHVRISAGFTLIELMVVVAMVAIMATLAAPSLRQFAANQELSGVTSNLVSAAMTARGTAINRNAQVVLEPISGTDWLSGWRIYIDKNNDGNYSAENDELVFSGVALPDTVEINGSPPAGCSFKDKIAYKSNGFLGKGGTSQANGAIPLKSKVTGRERCVVFDLPGRARICGNQGALACSGS